MAKQDNTFRYLLLGAGLLAFTEVSSWFADEKPGGNVPPGEGDTRPATFTLEKARQVARIVYEAIRGSQWLPRPWEYDQEAANALMQAKVTADVLLLMNAYAEHDAIHTEVDLTADLARWLDTEYRAQVNANYASKGIDIRF